MPPEPKLLVQARKCMHPPSLPHLPPPPPSTSLAALWYGPHGELSGAIMPCFVCNPREQPFQQSHKNQGAPACTLVRVQVGPFGSSPTSAIWGGERSRPHVPCPSITGEGEGSEGSRWGGRGGGGLKLKGEALASASGQASRCGDPGLFELKWWLRDHGP